MSLSGLDNDQVQHLKTVDHHNYITIFGDGDLKTGVAAESRKSKRLLEQGSTAAMYFTECDGYVARQIERYVSFNLKIKQALSWETKAGLFNKHVSREEAKNILEGHYQRIVEILPSEYQVYLKKQPEFFYNDYLADLKGTTKVNEFQFIDHFQTTDVLSGIFKGVYGQTLLFEDEGSHFLVNTKAMLGLVLSIDKKAEKRKLSVEPKKISFKKNDTEVLSLF